VVKTGNTPVLEGNEWRLLIDIIPTDTVRDLRDRAPHMIPCHHALAEAPHAYIEASGIAADKKAFLLRTSRGHGTVLADQPMT
jgi:hypothetical protein